MNTASATSRSTRARLIPVLAAPLLVGCGGTEIPGDLERGFRIVQWWTNPSMLARSSFAISYPDGQPSELLEFLYSPIGLAEWPPMEGSGEFSSDEEALLVQSGQPVIPAGLRFVHGRPDTSHGKQIVLVPDDKKGLIIAEAYIDPHQPPLARREYRLKTD
jgi:hypothetical protein